MVQDRRGLVVTIIAVILSTDYAVAIDGAGRL